MEKSIYTDEYAAYLRLLREARQQAQLTQVQVAERLELTQSQWSKIERGETRLDVVQLRTVCRALGLTLTDFAQRLDSALAEPA